MKNKTKVLLTSLATIAMSASLAVGGTYALFTSEDKVNIAVTSGTVNIKAQVKTIETGTKTGNGIVSVNNEFTVTETDGEYTFSKMLPGDFAVVTMEVTNGSNVDVLYRSMVSKEGGLADALVWEANSTWSLWATPQTDEEKTKEIQVRVEFPTDGELKFGEENKYNQYQNTEATLTFTVQAVQSNAEVKDELPENTVAIYTIADLKAFAADVNSGNTYAGKTVLLMSDFDLKGELWTPIGPNADANNKFKGTFDGQGHTISNLKVEQGAAYHAAGFFGALNGTAKNFTIENATIDSLSSGSNTDNGTAVVAGSIYTTGKIDNVHVKNATVNGNRYVGGISGYTYGSVTNCSVEYATLTATIDNLSGEYDNGDKVGGIVGAWWSENTYVISGNTVKDVTLNGYRNVGGIAGYCSGTDIARVTDNKVENVTLLQDKANGYKSEEAIKNTVNAVSGGTTEQGNNTVINASNYNYVEANDSVKLAEALKSAGANSAYVSMTEDVEMESATTAPYGNKYAVAQNGGVLDGNGHELYMECYGDDYGVMTSGGTIKNLTIQEGCRAIMIMYPTQDVILDNVNIGGDGVLYPINTGESAGVTGLKLTVTNSVIKGWTSYEIFESASFTNCKFGQGTYYNNIYGRVVKPYVTTTFTNCDFADMYNLDLSALGANCKVTFVNCTFRGQPLTAENFYNPEDFDGDYDRSGWLSYDLPSGRTFADCVTFA